MLDVLAYIGILAIILSIIGLALLKAKKDEQ